MSHTYEIWNGIIPLMKVTIRSHRQKSPLVICLEALGEASGEGSTLV